MHLKTENCYFKHMYKNTCEWWVSVSSIDKVFDG